MRCGPSTACRTVCDTTRSYGTDPVAGTDGAHHAQADGPRQDAALGRPFGDRQPAAAAEQRAPGARRDPSAAALGRQPRGLAALRGPRTGDGPAPHVQRAVGFEFEAGSLDSKRQKSGAMQPLKRKDVILASPPLFTMEADEKESGGSDVEFVTSPFPE